MIKTLNFLWISGVTFFLVLIHTDLVSARATDKIHRSSQHDFKVIEVVSGLQFPWGMAFLPNGNILITEKKAKRLRIIKNGQLDPNPIKGLPKNIQSNGQGGLLDVAIHPDFKTNRLIYLSYSAKGKEKGTSGTEVARARLEDDNLQDLEIIFKLEPKAKGGFHYGCRLVFAADGTLFLTGGDRYYMADEAQNPENHIGSVMRIHDDGTIPSNNPFVNHAKYKPEIYSYGHRNGQGLARRPTDDSIWMHEHGPKGGDELNKLDEPGANYGWPAVTFGIDYSGAIISDKTHAPGIKPPVVHWTPSIAPSGMAFYDGNKFPEWKGDLFVGALVQTHVRRLEMDGDKVVKQEVLLKGMARIRDVKSGPDGYLYLLTDAINGKLLRLENA